MICFKIAMLQFSPNNFEPSHVWKEIPITFVVGNMFFKFILYFVYIAHESSSCFANVSDTSVKFSLYVVHVTVMFVEFSFYVVHVNVMFVTFGLYVVHATGMVVKFNLYVVNIRNRFVIFIF